MAKTKKRGKPAQSKVRTHHIERRPEATDTPPLTPTWWRAAKWFGLQLLAIAVRLLFERLT